MIERNLSRDLLETAHQRTYRVLGEHGEVDGREISRNDAGLRRKRWTRLDHTVASPERFLLVVIILDADLETFVIVAEFGQ